jgi:F0F1-type ATP synthase delta subunit
VDLKTFKLPTVLASKQDVSLAHRELGIFIDMVLQSVMRHDKPVKYPPISATLRAVASENQIDIRDEKASRDLLETLQHLKEKATCLHVSFPNDPSIEILHKMVEWFRKEIDPHIIIQVGLQPTIAAGIVLRTQNHLYDFSLRQHLYKNRDKLIEVMTKNTTEEPQPLTIGAA